ncbi:PP2C family protein-serine/threonine phosphatase [Amycolatopsis sp. lyj-90]|uniref:PP2C family protein-serine/threonine phosphatase n=1 Tax=Amycolatopsis sp. lyj-90 TaxID=2789285 RepID=UPI00397B84D3
MPSLGFTPDDVATARGAFVLAKALVPEGFDDYLTHVEHALQDPRFVDLTKRTAEVTGGEPDDHRVAELATDLADHYLANPSHLKIVTGPLRPPPPQVAGFDLAVHYAPSEPDSPTGGDLYDWFVLPDGTVHVTLVDAVGHGVTSTRNALTVTHAIRTLALEGHAFQDLIGRAAVALATIESSLVATVLLARLDPATGDVVLANGSHPRPVLATTAGDTELLIPPLVGRGVGFPDPGSHSLVHRTLAPGDLLVLYTDGLIESRKDYVEGETRLLGAVGRSAGLPTAAIPGVLATQMHDVVLHADDTVVIAIRAAR